MSRTIPLHRDSPASPLPAPRAATGKPCSAAYRTIATISRTSRGATTHCGHDPVAAGVRAEGDAMDDVRENIPTDELGQIGGDL